MASKTHVVRPELNDAQYSAWVDAQLANEGTDKYMFTLDELKRMQQIAWAEMAFSDTPEALDEWAKGYLQRAVNEDRDVLAFYK